MPERFIPELTPYPEARLFAEDGSGKDAFRAFEKGPRGCIGEQLAMIESKIILALVVGAGFDFVAELADGEIAPCAVGGVDAARADGRTAGRLPISTVQSAEEWIELVKGGGTPDASKYQNIDSSRITAADFIKEKDLQRMRKWKGRTVEGYGIYQQLLGAAKPAYGMPGRIYLRH